MTTPTTTGEDLYRLLPQVLRLRDAEAVPGAAPDQRPLRALLEILASEVDGLRGSLDQFYADQFVETAAEWVLPYIGDLIGYRLIDGHAPTAPTRRAEIANTIHYRRRKGTASMLEQLARDVTGWPARAVEFFERLTTTQYMNHLRSDSFATADLRNHAALAWLTRLDAAFDDLTHTADVRRINAPAPHPRGRHNIPNIGIFLFRVASAPLARSPLVPAEPGDTQRFRFDPLGLDLPLYSLANAATEVTHLATPYDVPMPFSIRQFADDPAHFYGTGQSLLIESGTAGYDPVLLASVLPSDLRDVTTGWAHQPKSGQVAIDPERGRVYFGDPVTDPVATYYTGIAIPAGARTILRRADVPAAPNGGTTLPTPQTTASGTDFQGDLDTYQTGGTVILPDSRRWAFNPKLTTLPVPKGTDPHTLAVAALTQARPVIDTTKGIELDLAQGSHAILQGLLVAGGPVFLNEVGDGQPRTVVISDCTLVPGLTRTATGGAGTPGAASLIVLDPFATVVVDASITGPIVMVDGATLVVNGSIIDAGDPTGVAIAGRAKTGALRTVASAADMLIGNGSAYAGNVTLTGTTVIGGLHVERLDASDSILLADLAAGDKRKAAVWTERRQVGCVRFSWLPPTSRTGRRFHCVPPADATWDQQLELRPNFTSLRFGDAAYTQIAPTTPVEIRRGASDESEMGAGHDLYPPQRERDLTVRLDEYLRYGLEAGIFYAT